MSSYVKTMSMSYHVKTSRCVITAKSYSTLFPGGPLNSVIDLPMPLHFDKTSKTAEPNHVVALVSTCPRKD